MKRFLIVLYNYTTQIHFTKDPGAYAYSLSKYAGWDAEYAYFNKEKIRDNCFEKYCKLIYLGAEQDYNKEYLLVVEWFKENIHNYDVLMLFNYGGNTYKTANAAKKYNSHIKVYAKLDMNKNGFSHFYDGTLSRKIKAAIEIVKNRNIDLFTVENKYYFNVLNEEWPFRGRIKYLPNCVSLQKIDMKVLESIKKENIIITVGRLGDWHKHNELLVEAIEHFSEDIKGKWKVYFVGPTTKAFDEYINKKLNGSEVLNEIICLKGPVMDRMKLYELYARSKIFVLTSRSESFGIAAIESMYFGCYPILTDYGTIVKDITNDGIYGDVISQNDCELLADDIIKRMNDPDLILKGMEIKKYTRNNFSYEYWANRLSQYLSEEL